MEGKQVLVAVGAHTADMEFSAGATLLKHRKAGWDVHIVHLTLGEKGHKTLSPLEYGLQKKREAEEAAAILGAVPHFLPFKDGELTVRDEIARHLARLFRDLRPTVIITHWKDSIHTDHTACYHITRRARFFATNPHFELDQTLPIGYTRLFYAENWEDHQNFLPYVYVDITDVFDDWKKAFSCFAIGRGEGTFPYWDWYQSQTRIRGIEVGVSYAQAFAVDQEGMRLKKELL
ncbi:MAG: PIG-L family deacetylase [Armatimonadetes bacterium]|nr:PIG-L family deacetylase [Armatimonadota bacterium]MDW8121402.1 PIG-L family deacetylase [Armatimonadota bacterium]